ncbi:serine hydrolase [Longirhabdus pacifica]|uniref:serine hydrolase n=1 Tax=Longirhabdus pacifica TaxID=2305227 RepID=UPI001008D07F|nr:serine hydrolase [Longirhabdus pacifica]
MDRVVHKLREIDKGQVGLAIYSTKEQQHKLTLNHDIVVPLASSAKVAIAFCITKWVSEDLLSWTDILKDISFNTEEDSIELYPHLQNRSSLTLSEGIEVMIACHDSNVAKCIVNFCGGWEKLNQYIQFYFPTIKICENARDMENKAQLDQMLELMIHIYKGYQTQPLIWTPIINGLVRQRGGINQIPIHHLNHMTGGLKNVVVDIGIMGDFNKNPYIFALGATNLPDRYNSQIADKKIAEVMTLLYQEYKQQ